MTADRIPRFVQEHLIEGRPVAEWVFANNPLAQEPSRARSGAE
jgi:(2Fe-2S) ferredoxin